MHQTGDLAARLQRCRQSLVEKLDDIEWAALMISKEVHITSAQCQRIALRLATVVESVVEGQGVLAQHLFSLPQPLLEKRHQVSLLLHFVVSKILDISLTPEEVKIQRKTYLEWLRSIKTSLQEVIEDFASAFPHLSGQVEDDVIEGIFLCTEDNQPVVIDAKSGKRYPVRAGQGLDLWVSEETYVRGYYVPAFNDERVVTEHQWQALSGGGFCYLAGRDSHHNGGMGVHLHQTIYITDK
jgi:hypothetical protein